MVLCLYVYISISAYARVRIKWMAIMKCKPIFKFCRLSIPLKENICDSLEIRHLE